MNLNRMTYRLAIVAALSNHGVAPFPTLAGGFIYDSKIDPQEVFEGKNAFPIAVVYTDYDKDFPPYKGMAHEQRLLTVTIEMMVVQTKDPIRRGDGTIVAYTLESPTTDSELEIALDLFEAQVFRTLFHGTSKAAECFRSLMPGYENVISRRGASAEGQKLAARQTTIEGRVLRDPITGTIPPYIEAFFAELEENADYQDRVAGLRELYTADKDLTDHQRIARAMGLTTTESGMLGLELGPPVRLGSPVRWLNPDGSPLG